MQQPVPHLIPVLKANLAFVPASRVDFIKSLIAQYEVKTFLSEKQWFWVAKIAGEMLNPPAPVAKPTVGDFAAVIALFKKASGKLKTPRVALTCELPGKVELVMADPQTSKYPGTVQVIRKIGGVKEWLGRVEKDGTVTLSKKVNDSIKGVLLPALTAFAKDPQGVAHGYGKLTGSCCFCKKTLTTKESLAAGYGPDCADHFGLPWGGTINAWAGGGIFGPKFVAEAA